MRTIAWPWETWRAVIDALRAKGLPSMLDHADHLTRQLDQHPADQPTVAVDRSDDVSLRSVNGARWQLGIPRGYFFLHLPFLHFRFLPQSLFPLEEVSA